MAFQNKIIVLPPVTRLSDQAIDYSSMRSWPESKQVLGLFKSLIIILQHMKPAKWTRNRCRRRPHNPAVERQDPGWSRHMETMFSLLRSICAMFVSTLSTYSAFCCKHAAFRTKPTARIRARQCTEGWVGCLRPGRLRNQTALRNMRWSCALVAQMSLLTKYYAPCG